MQVITKLRRLNRLFKPQSSDQNREFLSMMIDSARDYAIFSTDRQGHILSWNAGAERMFGYAEAEILHQDAAIIYTPEDRSASVPEQERQIAEATGMCEDERWHLRKSGQRFFAMGTVRPMRDEKNNLKGFIKIARDMTERKQIEQEAIQALTREQEARREAETANSMRQRFMGVIAHELRTPLTSIKGFTSTLLTDDIVITEAQKIEFLQIVDEEANNLNNLVEQLLDASQVETGTFSIRTKPESLLTIIDSARAQLHALTLNHTLNLSIPQDLPLVMADKQRAAQVIVNLVGNAAKFSPLNTLISVNASVKQGFVQVDITDQGPGIPPSKRDVVFETFTQLEMKDPRGNNKGVGLGLAICKGIVEAHQGTIWVQESEGPGTTISFTLPIVDTP